SFSRRISSCWCRSPSTGYSISDTTRQHRSNESGHTSAGRTRGTTSLMLIFLHIPKTAGTTLATILDRNYGNAVLRLYASTSGEELATMSGGQLDEVRVVMCHFSFGAHRFVEAPCS